MTRTFIITALSLAAAAPVYAQDTRTVAEPRRPATCTTLRAQLTAVGDTTLAAADERRLDTERIQRAIDGCKTGAIVLAADGTRDAYVTGPIRLHGDVTLVVDSGAVLFASRDPRQYDVRDGSCGVVTRAGHGCRPLITVERAAHAGVMGPGTIDGRGWATLAGRDSSWWDLAQYAKVTNASQNCPRLIQVTRSDDFTLYRITLRNSPNFHVVFQNGNGFTAWGVVIHTPDPRARNTDGIDPASSTNVTITRSFIDTGDDDVAIKAGASTGGSSHITISHDHFYRGHGASIGSETDGGASDILVTDLSIDGADNGLRIKSNAARGGVVERVTYRDVCIRNTKHPIEMDTHYSASPKTTGDAIPHFRDIRLENVRVLGGGQVILDGYDAARPLAIAFDDVMFDSVAKIRTMARFVAARVGPGPFNLPLSGEGVTVSGSPSDAPGNACTGKFVPMPSGAATAAAANVARGSVGAVVSADYAGPDGAMVDGVATFRTIGAALSGLPVTGAGRVVILVKKGRYHEKLTVDRPYLTLRGEGRDATVISYAAASGTPTGTGGTWGTRGSFTLRVVAPDFRAEHLTIENAFDYPANAAKADGDPTKVKNAQAVALLLDMDSDRAVLDDVRITGYQDTLFPNAGRAYFHDCEVTGNVDFIFGAGRALFDRCTIVSRDRGSATNNGYITAPSTPGSQRYGFVFLHSRLTKETPRMAPSSVALGRPWHPYAKPDVSSSAVFIDCWMDDHIGERGWDRMSSVDSTGTRTWNEPENARFFEYGSTGPGAVASPRRRTLTAAEAEQYTPARVLDGWVPAF